MPRVCTVCSHPDRESIDKAIVDGVPIRTIADRYDLSRQALIRHRDEHLPATLVKAHEAHEVTRADQLLEQIEKLVGESEELIAHGKSGEVDAQAWASGIREARRCLELLAKITGELDETPKLELHLNTQWIQLRGEIVTALQGYPEALSAVRGALNAG